MAHFVIVPSLLHVFARSFIMEGHFIVSDLNESGLVEYSCALLLK